MHKWFDIIIKADIYDIWSSSMFHVFNNASSQQQLNNSKIIGLIILRSVN